MALLGPKTVLFGVLSLLLALYINYPAPTEISKHLAGWEREAAKTTIFRKHRIFYKDTVGTKPEGPVLVCLHGFPTSSYDWLKVWPALQDKFGRIIAPDFLGYGFSDKPRPHAYSIFEQADLVEELLASLGLTEVHLLTHDYGDTVGQEILARYEDRLSSNKNGLVIKSLCLLNGGMFPETNFPRPLQKALLIPYVGDILGRLTNIHVFSRGFGEVFGPETQPSDAEFKDFWALIRKNDGNLVMGPLLKYIEERSANKQRWTGVLQKTKIPVQTIYGPADPVNPPGFVDFYKKTVPNPYVSVLDGYIGHYPQWEDPAGVMKAYFKFIKTLPYKKESKTVTSQAKETSSDDESQRKSSNVKTTKPKSDNAQDKKQNKTPNPKLVDKDRKDQKDKRQKEIPKPSEQDKQFKEPKEQNQRASTKPVKKDKETQERKDKQQNETPKPKQVNKERKTNDPKPENKNKETKDKKQSGTPKPTSNTKENPAKQTKEPHKDTQQKPAGDKKEFVVNKNKGPGKKRQQKDKDFMPGDSDFIDIDLKRRDKN